MPFYRFLAFVAVLAVLGASAANAAKCPFSKLSAATSSKTAVKLPSWHPANAGEQPSAINEEARTGRTIKQSAAAALPAGYADAVRAMIDDASSGLRRAVRNCLINPAFMRYNPAATGSLENPAAIFPAGAWLRAYFHDAGTFLKSAGKGGKAGGPNGSLGAGCSNKDCGKCAEGSPGCMNPGGTDPAPLQVSAGAKCADGGPAVTGFTISGSFCCPAGSCVAHASSDTSPLDVVPACLPGTATFAADGSFDSYTNELCRRENDGLLDPITFYRNRQANVNFQYRDAQNQLQPVSLADIIYMAAVAAIESCSGGQVKPDLIVGRTDATVADDSPLPSVAGVVEDKHNSIFQRMGLNKNDMVTLVTGTHSVGGYRSVTSPGLTTCPFVPFDCTPSGQFGSTPFDNNVFKVACDGIQGVSAAGCTFNTACPSTTDTTTSQAANPTTGTCPFSAALFPQYHSCTAVTSVTGDGSTTTFTGVFPKPGLSSDRFLCTERTTQQRMVAYAQDQAFFFSSYAKAFVDLGQLGWGNARLVRV